MYMNWKNILKDTIYKKITYYDVSSTPTLVMITDLEKINNKFSQIHQAYINYIDTIPSTYGYLINSPGFLADNLTLLDLITIWDENDNFTKWLTHDDWCIIDLEEMQVEMSEEMSVDTPVETSSLINFFKKKQQQLTSLKDWGLDQKSKSVIISEPSSF